MKTLSLLIFICLSVSINAQTWTVKGVVTNGSSGEALIDVNVYINGTTIGTKTDSTGQFRLTNIKLPKVEIIASMVGFESVTRTISFKEDKLVSITIALSPADKNLEEFTVKAQKDKSWEKLMKQFETEFLGNEPFAKQTFIKNRWEINPSKVETTGSLYASANKPLEIENRALGYRVFFELKRFEVKDQSLFFSGYSRFEELAPTNDKEAKKWQENRMSSYRSSDLFFFKSLIDGSLKANGFMVYSVNKNYAGKTVLTQLAPQLGSRLFPFTDSLAVSKMPNSEHYLLHFPAELEILNTNTTQNQQTYQDAPYAISWLSAKRLNVVCTKDGLVLQPDLLAWAGEIANKRMAHLLPLNYTPPVEVNKTLNKQRIDSLATTNRQRNKESEKVPIATLKSFIKSDSLMVSIEVKNHNNEPFAGKLNVVITEHTLSTELDTLDYQQTKKLNGITQEKTPSVQEHPPLAKIKGFNNVKPDVTVSSQEIQSSNAVDILTVLQAKIPGVTVVQTIEDGVSRNVLYLRASNQNKLGTQGNFQPLVLVNGVPFANNVLELQAIPPNSVQSIEIYKRANPVLGIRSYNGVLNIVTQSSQQAGTAATKFFFKTLNLSNGKAAASFETPEKSKKYAILVTGITTDNQKFMAEKYIFIR